MGHEGYKMLNNIRRSVIFIVIATYFIFKLLFVKEISVEYKTACPAIFS